MSIRITDTISIDEAAIEERFTRAPGPGGQNVNKVETAVQLRLVLDRARSLPYDVRRRLAGLAGRRLTARGEIVIDAHRHRTREANRRDAMDRLVALVRQASTPPKPRRATKVPAGAKRRRLEDKRRRATLKRLRRPSGDLD